MITPCPPGIPAVLPGERPTEPVLRYLSRRAAAAELGDADACPGRLTPAAPGVGGVQVLAAQTGSALEASRFSREYSVTHCPGF